MADQSDPTESAEAADGDQLEWKICLGDADPKRRIVVLLFALAAGIVGTLLISFWLGLIGFAAILLSTSEMFLPLSYRLNARTARVKNGLSVTEIAWEDVKRVLPVSDGIKLSPLKNPSRLDAFRGVYLRFADNEDEVSGKIRQFWNGDTNVLGGRSERSGRSEDADGSCDEDPEAEA
ncbi:MAG: hypothetical protein IH944_12725 [Armatimonadetes bacterium]|nr:hypothetical protein [Armatimonadota bacterium]